MHKYIGALLFLLLFLVACGGAEESAIEEAPATDVESGEEAAEELVEEPFSAIGSEEDSGALPPPINTGSKVTATAEANGETAVVDVLFIVELSEDTAVTVAELGENWEDTLQKITVLPSQPEVNYATIFVQPNAEMQIISNDFAPSPAWEALISDVETESINTNNMNAQVSQLSWRETSTAQIYFILLSPSLFADQLLLASETAVYYPIITPEMNITEAALLLYETEMAEVNGRIIQLDNNEQTTLSEQIILAFAEAITVK